MTFPLLLLVLAFVSFVIEALPVDKKVNFTAIGLALWSLSIIVATI